MHLVGDIHQPLHTTSRYTDDLPNGDYNANKFPIKFGDDPYLTNLHALWDSCIDSLPNSLEKSIAPVDEEFFTELVDTAEMIKELFEKDEEDAKFLDWDAIIEEGHVYATDFIYEQMEENGTPSASYQREGTLICQSRIALAGYRLAEVMRQLFKVEVSE